MQKTLIVGSIGVALCAWVELDYRETVQAMADFKLAQIAAGHYDEAVATLSREETYGTGSREALVAALAMAGRLPEAQEEARLFLADNPSWNISDQAVCSPFRSTIAAQPFIDGWRLAGLPE